MRCLLLLVTLLLLMGVLTRCTERTVVPSPPDTVDVLTGTTWVRYGFRNSVTGKNMYHYLTFKKLFQVDDYMRYEQPDTTAVPPKTYTYTYAYAAIQKPPIRSITILIDGVDYLADINTSSETLILHGKSHDLIYTKE